MAYLRGGEAMIRLWNKVVRDEATGCWLWMGSKRTGGYGNIKIAGKARTVHRR